MIKIIGTTHLVKSKVIEDIIKKEKPDMIGVELCKTRFDIFTKPLEQLKQNESLVGKISNALNKKSQEENLDYGSDMKSAMFYAINNKIPLLLLDKDINEITNSLQAIPESEKVCLQEELLKFESMPLQKDVDEEKVLLEMKKRIPVTYHILVESRDNYITDKIREFELCYKNKRILIFLGKAHVKSILKKLSERRENKDIDRSYIG